jgi:thioredoxin reductase
LPKAVKIKRKMKNHFEVIIIGGSYAGLSAAMALGRSLRRVLVVDSGKPCNRYTPHSHNFITQDGEKPFEIAQKAKNQVLKYDTVTLREDLVLSASQTEFGFEVITAEKRVTASKLIIATGIRDIFPAIEGFEDCWGKTIIHCPYCHGYEFKGENTGIMANGERAFHLASLVNNLSDSISLITSGKADFTEDQLYKLERNKINIIEKEIKKVVHENGELKEVRFDDDSVQTFTALYAALPFEQSSSIPVALGCEMTEMGYINTGFLQKTTVPGVYACGDNAGMMRSVASAVASGNTAGAGVNSELTAERF